MNKIMFSHLKIHDPELMKTLYECEDYKQAFETLNKLEASLDKQLEVLEGHVDAQNLLDELHRYNDVKDMTQVLIGSLAIVRGVTVSKLHVDYGLELTS